MTAQFWDTEPEAVRAVLTLAAARQPMRDAGLDWDLLIAQTYPGNSGELIDEIADALAWREDLRADRPLEVLHRFLGKPFTGSDAVQHCDDLAATCESAALQMAQMIAATQGRAA